MSILNKGLVVDASIFFSFFKKDSTRRQIFEELLNNDYRLISPYFTLEELRKDREKIMKFSNITAGDFEFTLSTIKDEIELISVDKYNKYLTAAEKLSPHKKDISYFALALSFNLPIWSDEKAFNQQESVNIITTKMLFEKFKDINL